jgi:fructosamine-3-kinase
VSDGLTTRLGEVIGADVVASTPVSGGDINQAVRAELADGRVVFAKRQPPGDANAAADRAGLFAIEADGLRRLGAAGTVRVPEVVAVADDLLVLEWVDTGRPAADFDRVFGEQLAGVHRVTGPSFGLDHDGPVPASLRLAHDDTPAPTWPEFYGRRRLEPLVRHNLDHGRLPPESRAEFDRLIARLPELCGPAEPPTLLHGDLWAGNCISDDRGRPVLVDPHVHFGHREIDLAMMRLFGGFGAGVFAAYAEAHPLADGHADRVPLYQLHPLLNHVALFGTGYTAATLDALRRYR